MLILQVQTVQKEDSGWMFHGFVLECLETVHEEDFIQAYVYTALLLHIGALLHSP